MRELANFLIGSLASQKEKVSLDYKEEGDLIKINVKLDTLDKGKIIGKDGSIAEAIRTVLKASASKNGKKVMLKIEDQNA